MARVRIGRNQKKMLLALYRYAPDKMWTGEIVDAANLVASPNLYQSFRKLENDRNYVESEWEPAEVAEAQGRPRRRYYQLTSNGFAYVENQLLANPAHVTLIPGFSLDPPLIP